FDEKRSIINNPIVKCILSSLEIISRNYRFEDVFSYIKTGFSPLNRTAVEELENFVLEFGIKGKIWFHDFKQETWNYNLEEINKYRKKLISPFFILEKGISDSKTVSEYTSHLFEFLQDIDLKEQINIWINDLRDSGQLEYVNENSQIWSIVIEVFQQLIDIMGEEVVEFSEYISILRTGFTEYELGIIPPTLDQVMIGSPDRSRSHDIKVLFLIGVNDGLLPSVTENDGILMDDEKILLKNLGLQLSSDSISRGQEEQLNIYSTITRPSEYLWMSFSQSDMEGKTLRPSLLINKVKKIFTDLKINSDLQQETEENDPVMTNFSINKEGAKNNYDTLLSDITVPAASLKYLLNNLREYVETGQLTEKWQQVFDWYYHDNKWNWQLDRIIEGLFHSNQQEYLYRNQAESNNSDTANEGDSSNINSEPSTDLREKTDLLVKKDLKLSRLYDLPLKTSISRLQQYSRCPFAHYVKYALRPVEREEYRLEPVDFGNLYHQIIEEFGRYLLENGLKWSELELQEIEPIIEEIVDRVINEFENSIFYSSKRYSYMINKVKRVSKRIISVITYQLENGEFQPAFYELSFSTRGDIPSLIVELDEKQNIEIEGRIDRVDIMYDDNNFYLKVIDYKTGSKRFSLSEVYYGLELQLIIYMTALLRNKEQLVKALNPTVLEEVAAANSELSSGQNISPSRSISSSKDEEYLSYDECLSTKEDECLSTKEDEYLSSNQGFEISPAGFFYFRIDDPLVNQNDVQDGQVEDEIIKELKLDGIVLDKAEVIKSLDRKLEPGISSSIIPVKLNKDGTPSKNSSVLNISDLDLIIDHVINSIGQAGKEIIEGRIIAEPVRVKNKYTACDYCPYDAICQFDSQFIDNEYREISKLKDGEVLGLIKNSDRAFDNDVTKFNANSSDDANDKVNEGNDKAGNANEGNTESDIDAVDS
ncbi:MAG: PD-(D/E)XK nuclease family protein, partial [Halanaerobiales bacterium]